MASRIRAVLLDLDGVLYVEDEPVPGAVEAVEALRRRELVLRFVDATPRRGRGGGSSSGWSGSASRSRRAELVTPAALAVQSAASAGTGASRS